MARVPVKLNLQAINAIMKDKKVADELDRRGQKVANRAGRGFVVRTDQPEHRWIARTRVIAATRAAREAEARDNALLRSLDAARD